MNRDENKWMVETEEKGAEVAKESSSKLLVSPSGLHLTLPWVASKRFSHPALISDQPLRNVLTVKESSLFEDRLAKHSCDSFSLSFFYFNKTAIFLWHVPLAIHLLSLWPLTWSTRAIKKKNQYSASPACRAFCLGTCLKKWRFECCRGISEEERTSWGLCRCTSFGE